MTDLTEKGRFAIEYLGRKIYSSSPKIKALIEHGFCKGLTIHGEAPSKPLTFYLVVTNKIKTQ